MRPGETRVGNSIKRRILISPVAVSKEKGRDKNYWVVSQHIDLWSRLPVLQEEWSQIRRNGHRSRYPAASMQPSGMEVILM